MKSLITSILLATLLIGGAFMISKKDSGTENISSGKNVFIEDGVQIVEIKARGGYFPMKSVAKAGIPTVIRFNSESTFDCSAAVRIPKLNVSKNLPISGLTDIELNNPEPGLLQGYCSMGMYPFEIDFQ